MHVSVCPCFLLRANEPIDMEKFQEPLFIWMPRTVVIKINGELQKILSYSKNFVYNLDTEENLSI